MPYDGFNGADVFQRRRPQLLSVAPSAHDTASMGPTSFNVGDEPQRDERQGQQELQWGRRLSTSETARASPIEIWRPSLQWGRRLSTSETSRLKDHKKQNKCASMGPTSFNVGDFACGKVEGSRGKWLQWGRRLSTSETDQHFLVDRQHLAASMGPTSFNVGDRDRKPFPVLDHTASMGPTSFNVGDAVEAAKSKATRESASMGPTSFNVGDQTSNSRVGSP